MSEEKKLDAILNAIPWRCFHCDFITSDPAEAQAHFGERDDAEEFTPICKWWSGVDDDERKHIFQELQRDLAREQDHNGHLRLEIENLEDKVGAQEAEMHSYKPFKECLSIYDIFCKYDSMEGRALAAENRIQMLLDAMNSRGFIATFSDDEVSIV